MFFSIDFGKHFWWIVDGFGWYFWSFFDQIRDQIWKRRFYENERFAYTKHSFSRLGVLRIWVKIYEKSDQKRECALECYFDAFLMDFDLQTRHQKHPKSHQISKQILVCSLDGLRTAIWAAKVSLWYGGGITVAALRAPGWGGGFLSDSPGADVRKVCSLRLAAGLRPGAAYLSALPRRPATVLELNHSVGFKVWRIF